jgi:adenylosuccinate synthase
MVANQIDHRVHMEERSLVARILAAEGYGVMVAPRELVDEIRTLLQQAMEVVPDELRLHP